MSDVTTGSPIRRLSFSRLSPWMAIPVLVAEIVLYLDRGRPWRGDWLWTADWAGGGLFVAGAIAALAVAVDAGLATRRRKRRREPAGSEGRAVVSAALPGLVTVGSVHLVAVAGYAVTTATAVEVAPPWSFAVLTVVQLAGVAFYTVVGAVSGRLLGPVVGGVAAPVAVLASAWAVGRGGFSPVDFGSSTGGLVGFDVSYGSLGTQVVVLAAATVALLAVRTRPLPSGRRTPTARGAVTLGLSAVLLLVPAWFAPDQRYVLDADGPTACVGEHVDLCFFPGHREIAEAIVSDVDRLYLNGAARGVADLLPTRLVETARGHGTADGAADVTLSPDELEGGTVTRARLAEEIVVPGHCRQLRADERPADEYFLMVEAMTIYLTSLEEYVVDHVGFPSLDEYRHHVEKHGDGLAVDGTGPRELTLAEARTTLERLWTCAF